MLGLAELCRKLFFELVALISSCLVLTKNLGHGQTGPEMPSSGLDMSISTQVAAGKPARSSSDVST